MSYIGCIKNFDETFGCWLRNSLTMVDGMDANTRMYFGGWNKLSGNRIIVFDFIWGKQQFRLGMRGTQCRCRVVMKNCDNGKRK